MQLPLLLVLLLLLVLGACGNPPGAPTSPSSPTAGADLASTGDALAEAAHVSATGAYQTHFAVPVPPGPGASAVSLNYHREANGSLAGIGWDLSVGYPLSITRDIRFGTP